MTETHRPLIPDSVLSRVFIGAVGAVLTVFIGWASKELSQINESTTKTLEDIELFQVRQEETAQRVDRISVRVDKLYEIELNRGRKYEAQD